MSGIALASAEDPLGHEGGQVGRSRQARGLARHQLQVHRRIQMAVTDAQDPGVGGLDHGQGPGGRQVGMDREEGQQVPHGRASALPGTQITAHRGHEHSPGRGQCVRGRRLRRDQGSIRVLVDDVEAVGGRHAHQVQSRGSQGIDLQRSGRPGEGGVAQQARGGRGAGPLERTDPQRSLIG